MFHLSRSIILLSPKLILSIAISQSLTKYSDDFMNVVFSINSEVLELDSEHFNKDNLDKIYKPPLELKKHINTDFIPSFKSVDQKSLK